MTSLFSLLFMRAQQYLHASTALEVSFWKYAEIIKKSSNCFGLPVDQGLWVVLAEVSQQLVNEPADQRPGSVNSSNKLRYNLEPIVNLDGADALM